MQRIYDRNGNSDRRQLALQPTRSLSSSTGSSTSTFPPTPDSLPPSPVLVVVPWRTVIAPETPQGSPDYFNGLPPSPETPSPFPRRGSSSRTSFKSCHSSPVLGAYPSPPNSAPGSTKMVGARPLEEEAARHLGGPSQPGGSGELSTKENDSGASVKSASGYSNASSGVNLLSVHDGAKDGQKRRPSLVLTSAQPDQEHAYGLGLGLDPPEPVPLSPRFGRRQYPAELSPRLPSSPSSSHFSTPLSSPVFGPSGSFLSPLPSPNLPSSSSAMLREPSSPRFSTGTITEPIARLVRRASSNSLNVDLPTSVVHSPVPSRSPGSSPTLPASSPSIGFGSNSRRSSFAAQGREQEKEKEKELAARGRKSKSQPNHNRMFSWAERSGSVESVKARAALKKRLAYGAALIALAFLLAQWWGKAVAKPIARPPRNLRSRVPGAGLNFIHPDVLNRRPPPSKSVIGAPWRWLQQAFTSDGRSAPARQQSSSPDTRPRSSDASSKAVANDTPKKRNLFVPAKPVAYTTPHALPPPPVHSDAPERDTLVLYRILGNDLPPRHSPGQTLRNLRFLLQHESDFSTLPHVGPHLVHHAHSYGSGSKAKSAHTEGGGLRVDKYFILNRIAEPEMVSAIMGLLARYSVPSSRILVIPFKWEEYEHRDFRWDGGVDSLLGWGIGPQDEIAKARAALLAADIPPEPVEVLEQDALNANVDLDAFFSGTKPTPQERKRKSEMLARLRALDFTYHEKNLYAMNNNGGRNFALQHGRSLPHARWVLPLDGNSFFTPVAMHSIVQTLSIAGEGSSASRYVVIPMARLLNNGAVLANNSIKLVPHTGTHEATSARADAIVHHRPESAPITPEEPQIGFRYDSTETFQEAMRYGRRSKLELLWRLGAIPYSRGLDRRTLPWEQSDRDHITADSWASIPGVEGTDKTSPVHQPHGDALITDFDPPSRGPTAFAKAGWVYRLFSGDQNQELHTQEAIALRNMNRIKGIVAFLERLDEQVARGVVGCDYAPRGQCGFSQKRLWNFELDDVERLRQQFKAGIAVAVSRVENFEVLVNDVHTSVRQSFGEPSKLANADPAVASMNATLLAMAGYLTANSSYSTLAADLITARFVRQVPMFYRVVDQREQLKKYLNGQGPPPIDITQFDGLGYAFPAPPSEAGEVLSWSAAMGHHLAGAELPRMPFDPLHFDPILLMDAVRLLSSPNAPKNDFIVPDSRNSVVGIFTTQLSYLLFNPTATAFSAEPPSAKAGAYFDAKVAALAAFIDDARLFIRVANRARLRLHKTARIEGLLHPAKEIREVHYRLIQGVSRTRLVPYNLAADPMSEGMYHAVEHGENSPFDILGV
ncbi:hypothetical protein P7C70_g6220, partial [Phenoliferia sp. Uapishka_3]